MVERLDTDVLFRALADPSRRKLLDLLHEHDGRTLNDLCEHMDMTRQGVTQHLDLLEAANLVATVRRGRFWHPSWSERWASYMGFILDSRSPGWG